MRFTQSTPDALPFPADALPVSSLQIYSIKVIKLKGNLNWPLTVQGTVAARDTVDRNRNILFSRLRHSYQVLTENVCSGFYSPSIEFLFFPLQLIDYFVSI